MKLLGKKAPIRYNNEEKLVNPIRSKRGLEKVIKKRVKTFEQLLKGYVPDAELLYKWLKELIDEGKITYFLVFDKGYRLLFTKPDYDISNFKAKTREKLYQKINREREKANAKKR